MKEKGGKERETVWNGWEGRGGKGREEGREGRQPPPLQIPGSATVWNRFTKASETRKIYTSDWEVLSHIDYPTDKKARIVVLGSGLQLSFEC